MLRCGDTFATPGCGALVSLLLESTSSDGNETVELLCAPLRDTRCFADVSPLFVGLQHARARNLSAALCIRRQSEGDPSPSGVRPSPASMDYLDRSHSE